MGVSKSSWTVGGGGKADLTYSVLTAISIKIVSLGTYTTMAFLPSFPSIVEIIFFNAVEYCFRVPLDALFLDNNRKYSFRRPLRS
jgi:hypothetical protein